MGVLDTAILIGKETTYGTAATLTRGYEAKSDDFALSMEQLESVGFRPGMHTLRRDRLVSIRNGGTGTLEVDVLNKGMGLLLEGCLGAAANPSQIGVTTAYMSSFTTATDGHPSSLTVQTLRPRVEDSPIDAFTHVGCKFTGWTLAQESGGLLTLTAELDFRDVNTSTAAGTPTYPTDALPFHWAQCSVSIGGVPFQYATGIELGTELGMRTDRRYLKGTHLKDVPRRNAVPTLTGTLSTDYADLTRFNQFAAGTVVENLVLTWTGAVIEGANSFSFKVIIPAIVWTEGTPVASLSESPTQSLPFRVLHNGTNPAMTMEIVSTDTAL